MDIEFEPLDPQNAHVRRVVLYYVPCHRCGDPGPYRETQEEACRAAEKIGMRGRRGYWVCRACTAELNDRATDEPRQEQLFAAAL